MGGATAQIGDPSGKTKDRHAMEIKSIKNNATKIKDTLQKIFDNHELYLCQHNTRLGPATK